MLQIPEKQVIKRLHLDNPWWKSGTSTSKLPYHTLPRRHYFALFQERVKQTRPIRALILMGPRRVGKTTIIHQVIAELITEGVPCHKLLYVAIDAPIYTGLSLDQLLNRFLDLHQLDSSDELTIFFDEIQYLKNWKVHLKSLVDTYPDIKFVVSGSAAALKMASNESGAGRFTDFFLPPLTFAEYLDFIKISVEDTPVVEINKHFIDYLNFGGFPEAVFSKEVQSELRVFIKNDIIDKVLLRDLPSLYGINNIQELNRLFTLLAYNTGQEVSTKNLADESGIAPNTIVKYIGYLEAAFLIFRVNRIDRDARTLKRITNFKVYLTNPSMRSALFDTVDEESPDLGSLVETALYSQWLHSHGFKQLYYSRFAGKKSLEVDIVCKPDGETRPRWAIEVKWSDKSFTENSRIKGILDFCKRHNISSPSITTKTVWETKQIDELEVQFYRQAFWRTSLATEF